MSLLSAAKKAGLKDPFVQIRHLGDFSVTYRIAGLCEDIEQLLANRRRLRAATLDELHNGGIEIVSPNFMNTRAVADGARIIPPVDETPLRDVGRTTPDAVVFDKAQQAESLENLREQRDTLRQKIEPLETAVKEFSDPGKRGMSRRRKYAAIRCGKSWSCWTNASPRPRNGSPTANIAIRLNRPVDSGISYLWTCGRFS